MWTFKVKQDGSQHKGGEVLLCFCSSGTAQLHIPLPQQGKIKMKFLFLGCGYITFLHLDTTDLGAEERNMIDKFLFQRGKEC